MLHENQAVILGVLTFVTLKFSSYMVSLILDF